MRSEREERIRQRAYTIRQSEGHQHGRHEDYWHRAEREIGAEEAAGSKVPRRTAGSGKASAEKAAAATPVRSRSATAAAQKPVRSKTRSTRARKPAAKD